MNEPGRPRDNSAIARLLVRHRSRLIGYIMSCVRNFDDSEEIFQEVAVTVVSSFDKLRDESGFLPWALEIARRHVLSHFRKSAKNMVYDTDLVDVLAKTANEEHAASSQDDRAAALAECLSNLSGRSRKVLQMRYGDAGYGVKEIANFLDSSMAATYGVLKRIRMALRACVEQRMAEGGVP